MWRMALRRSAVHSLPMVPRAKGAAAVAVAAKAE